MNSPESDDECYKMPGIHFEYAMCVTIFEAFRPSRLSSLNFVKVEIQLKEIVGKCWWFCWWEVREINKSIYILYI